METIINIPSMKLSDIDKEREKAPRDDINSILNELDKGLIGLKEAIRRLGRDAKKIPGGAFVRSYSKEKAREEK